jgi:hypothetical protein
MGNAWMAVIGDAAPRLTEAIKPPRLNFARICLYCGERDCTAPECIDSYERSRWMICPDCDGQEWNETLEPCGCMFGVVEAWPEPAGLAAAA